jgi:hypothetical protein
MFWRPAALIGYEKICHQFWCPRVWWRVMNGNEDGRLGHLFLRPQHILLQCILNYSVHPELPCDARISITNRHNKLNFNCSEQLDTKLWTSVCNILVSRLWTQCDPIQWISLLYFVYKLFQMHNHCYISNIQCFVIVLVNFWHVEKILKVILLFITVSTFGWSIFSVYPK